jgi:hypothetical protein
MLVHTTGQDTVMSRSGHGRDRDTFWQEHSHCRPGLGQGTDRTRPHSGTSIHILVQVSVRARTGQGHILQEHSHCSSDLGQNTDGTRTYSGRSIHNVVQVSVRARSGQRHILAGAFTV